MNNLKKSYKNNKNNKNNTKEQLNFNMKIKSENKKIKINKDK